MDLNSKQRAYSDLQDVKHLDADINLLKKSAPNSRVLRLRQFDKEKQQRQVLWALLDKVSVSDILKNRGVKLKDKALFFDEVMNLFNKLNLSEEVSQTIFQKLEEHGYFGEKLNSDNLSKEEAKEVLKKAEPFILNELSVINLNKLAEGLDLDDEQKELFKNAVLEKHGTELNEKEFTTEEIEDILSTVIGFTKNPDDKKKEADGTAISEEDSSSTVSSENGDGQEEGSGDKDQKKTQNKENSKKNKSTQTSSGQS